MMLYTNSLTMNIHSICRIRCHHIYCIENYVPIPDLLTVNYSFGHWTHFCHTSIMYLHQSYLIKVMSGLFQSYPHLMGSLAYNYRSIRQPLRRRVIFTRLFLQVSDSLKMMLEDRIYLNSHFKKIDCTLVGLQMMIEHMKIRNMQNSLKFTEHHILWIRPEIRLI